MIYLEVVLSKGGCLCECMYVYIYGCIIFLYMGFMHLRIYASFKFTIINKVWYWFKIFSDNINAIQINIV